MTEGGLALHCPVCGAESKASPPTCPSCVISLSGFQQIQEAPLAWFNVALSRVKNGDVAGASRAATAAVALQPGHVPSRLLLARLLARLEEWSEGLEHVGHALEVAPGSGEAEALYDALWSAQYLPDSAGPEGEEEGP